jgi:hypothetical protein
MNVTVKCTNAECMNTMDIPFVVDSVYPSIGAICAVCNGGMLVITKILAPGIQTKQTLKSQHPELVEEIEVYEQVIGDEHYLGGPNVLTAFQNRISPLIMSLQLMKEHGGDEGKIEFQELRRLFIANSTHVFKHLNDKVEGFMNVKRGQKLSDGFPPISKIGPLRIVMRNLIGIDEDRIFQDRGLLQSLGLIRVVGETHLQLTERAQVFTELPSIHRYLTTITHLETVSTNPVLPEYYEEELALSILDALFSVSEDQKAWTLHILREISKSEGVGEGKGSDTYNWDSTTYVWGEVLRVESGKSHPRWVHQSGMPLYEKYLEQGQRQGKHSPENHASSRLEKHISGKLGSLLSLFKELGLVHPIAVGNSKNYELSLRGRRVLVNYTEVIV